MYIYVTPTPGIKTKQWEKIGKSVKSHVDYLLTEDIIDDIDTKKASIFSLPTCKSHYTRNSGHTVYCSQYFFPKHNPIDIYQSAKIRKIFNTDSVNKKDNSNDSNKGDPSKPWDPSDLQNLYDKLQMAPDPLPPARYPSNLFIRSRMYYMYIYMYIHKVITINYLQMIAICTITTVCA